jgi:hypothetical protein
MNAVAVIEAAVTPAEEWIDRGRTLAAKRRDVDWAIADWMVEGKAAGHLDQAGFDFLADNLGIGPAKLKLIHKAAAIPAHLRDTSLTVEHHAHVAELPVQEQIELLTEAKRQHWSDDDLRKQTISRRAQIGGYEMLTPEEWEYHSLMAMQHAWNRAPKQARIDFLEIATKANGGLIDV